MRGDLSTVLGEVRRLVHDLRPPALDQFGLAGALRQAAERFSDGALAITVTVTGDLGALPAAVEVAAYRMASEALLNVVRHAGAGRCGLRLSLGVDVLEVEVADDGAGVPSGALVGVGVLGMRERAEELGGHCSVSSRAAGGTRVYAVLPLRATHAEPVLTAQKGPSFPAEPHLTEGHTGLGSGSSTATIRTGGSRARGILVAAELPPTR
uniref:sensor histidine kinase n=1 Tax=Acrocarpospora catenulata TaxID=2836182 RepID=UPI0027E1FEA0